jgi:hypothetical protein
MIKNTKIQNIIDIIKIFKSMGPNKCTYKKINENHYLNVSYDFKKIDGSNKIKA